MGKKVLVVGASGLVGAAVVKHLSAIGCDVVAVSRKPPEGFEEVPFVAADLFDETACANLFGAMGDVTHLIYTALYERPSLVSGWSDEEQIAVNERMFKAVLDPLVDAKGALRHVTLLQGTKAYGVHVRAIPVPAREDRDELRSQPNFYWRQEVHLRDRAAGAGWNWTILRPTLIVGGVVGGAMNALPAIGVFGALLKQAGLPFCFPGGGPRIAAAVDVDLLARAIDWAGETASARNRTFNVTNGDVYVWENVWPAIADALGMESGPPEPRSLHDFCGSRAADWDRIRKKHALVTPGLKDFVGPSLQYCDYLLRHGQPEPGPATVVSTVAIQQAGFHEVMDSEEMFRKWIVDLQDRRLLPPA
ncbi:MAG: NAD-dependent epimerase/dehydratase family protein [Pseudomonadota bacterium]